MKEEICVGDLVVSLAGRDKNRCYLVIHVDKTRVKIIDGKIHKILIPKTKNKKHIKKVLSAMDINVAVKIQKGHAVGNKKVYKLIMAENKKIQED